MTFLNWKNWSLKTSIILLLSFLIVATTSIITLIFLQREEINCHEALEQQAQLVLETLVASAQSDTHDLNPEILTAQLEELVQNGSLEQAHVYDAQGAIIASATTENHTNDDFGQALLQQDGMIVEWKDASLRAGRPFFKEGAAQGALSIEFSSAPLLKKLAQSRWQSLTLAFCTSLATITASHFLSLGLTAPLKKLANATQRIAAGDLGQPIILHNNSKEIVVLADALHDTAMQIRGMIKRLEQNAYTIEQRNQELLALQSAETAITSSLELQKVLDSVAQEMIRVLNTEACAIYEWDQNSNTLTLLHKHGFDNENNEEYLKTIFASKDHPLVKRVLQKRRPQRITIHQNNVNPSELAYMRAAKINTMLMLPMIFQGRIIGLTQLITGQTYDHLLDRKVALAQLMANQAAGAIENAHLYKKAQQEIIERKLMEEKISASLKEKDVLLKEIHHRVKNNLQIISSLLELQSDYTKDQQALDTLNDSRNRIYSMASIHEVLYQSKDLARVDFTTYIEKLVNYLLCSYNINTQAITADVNVTKVDLNIDSAIACGLIINELVSNSLKYAFPKNNPGKININLHPCQENQITLSVSDNGIGLPSDFDYRQTDSLGLQLVTLLTQQLNGTLKLEQKSGTMFTITFCPDFDLNRDYQNSIH